MSLPRLPTTTLAIVINWVQRMGQILDTARRYSRLFGEGGAKTGTGGEWSKKDARRAPGALILPLRRPSTVSAFDCISRLCGGATPVKSVAQAHQSRLMAEKHVPRDVMQIHSAKDNTKPHPRGKLGARDRILNTKVARRACAGQTFPLRLRCHTASCGISAHHTCTHMRVRPQSPAGTRTRTHPGARVGPTAVPFISCNWAHLLFLSELQYVGSGSV